MTASLMTSGDVLKERNGFSGHEATIAGSPYPLNRLVPLTIPGIRVRKGASAEWVFVVAWCQHAYRPLPYRSARPESTSEKNATSLNATRPK